METSKRTQQDKSVLAWLERVRQKEAEDIKATEVERVYVAEVHKYDRWLVGGQGKRTRREMEDE